MLRAAHRWPEREALVLPDRRLSYAELAERALATARSLAGLGVGRGDAVGLLLPNGADLLAGFFGAQLLGAVAVPVNTRFRARELCHVVESAGLAVVVAGPAGPVDLVGRLHEALPGLSGADPESLSLAEAPGLRAFVALDDERERGISRVRFAELGEGVDESRVAAARAAVGLRDVATLMFTSGTASAPRGCLLSHEAMVRVWASTAARLGWDGEERVFGPLPMFHMGCLGPVLGCFGVGATLVTMPHFEAGPGLEAIERERATWLYTVFPPVTLALIDHPDFPSRDLSRVRGLSDVGPPETLRRIEEALPAAVEVGGSFGMTEACGPITCGVPDADREVRLRTAGRPLPCFEVRIADPETGRARGAGEEGELQVRGVGLFEGYQSPEPEGWTKDGWLRSGDLGSLDREGRVTYVGRLKDMLKVGGENVAPAEVEAHLEGHPAIRLAQVVAAPDQRLGEVPAAFVELAGETELSEEEVIRFCAGSVASFKVPRHVRFVTEWPTSATKIQKFVLRERLLAELDGGGE